MEKSYDVVIVGGGPAGAQCARSLARNSKLSVLLMEQSTEIGEPKKSTAGTFTEAIKEFSLPKKVMMRETKDVVFEGPTTTATLAAPGAVLDFQELKKFLVEDGIHHGVDLSIATCATHPITKNGRVCGVQYHNLEGEGKVNAKVVIDATGPAALLARQIGLRDMKVGIHAKGMEIEMERVQANNDRMMLLRFDQKIAPGGYAWIFSTGREKAKVGNCWLEPYFKKMGGEGSSIYYLHKWMKSDSRIKNGLATEVHGGDAYTWGKPLPRVADGIVCVGDSVCSINPAGGEGIRPGMKSGAMAANAIIEALGKGKCDVKSLRRYEEEWNSYAKSWGLSHLLAKKMYLAPNKRIDQFIRTLKKIDAETVRKLVAYQFTKKDAIRAFGRMLL